MLFGIAASLLAVVGIVWGARRHSRLLVIGSVVALALIIAVWAYFWFNPY